MFSTPEIISDDHFIPDFSVILDSIKGIFRKDPSIRTTPYGILTWTNTQDPTKRKNHTFNIHGDEWLLFLDSRTILAQKRLCVIVQKPKALLRTDRFRNLIRMDYRILNSNNHKRTLKKGSIGFSGCSPETEKIAQTIDWSKVPKFNLKVKTTLTYSTEPSP